LGVKSRIKVALVEWESGVGETRAEALVAEEPPFDDPHADTQIERAHINTTVASRYRPIT
jgi:hypothetical protein